MMRRLSDREDGERAVRWSSALDSEVSAATLGVEAVHGRGEAGRRIDALYEKQRYDEGSIEFRKPTEGEMALYRIGPGHRVLYSAGVGTTWSYSRDADGRFTASARGLDFRYDDERHAQRATALIHDAISRQRDGGPDGIRYMHRALDGVRRYVATDVIDGAYVAVGTRRCDGKAFFAERVYEPIRLEPGTELFFMGTVTLALLGDPVRSHEVRFESPSGATVLADCIEFPAGRVIEVPCWASRSKDAGWTRAALPEYERE